uniref:Ig-like domain-containing protein n=1 Tax=Arion vulgaris TaxID=1028688 RepID=A0A0B7BBY3_9EUPU
MTQSLLRGLNLGLFLCCCLSGVKRVSSEVELPPRVTWRKDNQERIIIREGRGADYMINCTAEGNPSPSFLWRKDGQDLGEVDPMIKGYKNGTLYFKDFTDREYGLYECLASNQYGTSISVKVPVIIEKPPGPGTEDTDDVRLTPDEGNSVSFKCADTPPTVTEYGRRWYRKTDTSEVELNKRIGTDAEGSLRFAYVEPSDSDSYVCALAPRVAQQQDTIRIYNTVILNVNPVSQKAPTEPQLLFSTGSGYAKVFLNRTAILECFFSGLPEPEISWKNSSNQVVPAGNPRFRLEDFNRRLFITNVQPEDEGRFSCIANNGHGEKIVYISVNVTSPPFKVPNQGLTSLIKPEFSEVSLLCQARAAIGESLNRPEWYRNTEPLRESTLPDPSRYSFSPDHTQLVIRNINKNVDTACFQCNVSNSEGYTFYDGFLRVIDPIVITRRPNDFIEVGDNERIDISVSATGDACCTTHKEWSFEDTPLTLEERASPPLMEELSTDSMFFNTSGVSDSVLASRLGRYSVRVSNPYQDIVVEFTISKKGAVAQEVAAATFELWWIAIIIGVLVIIIVILIIICCVKRNYPGETYQLEKTELKHHLNPKEELLDQSFQEI